MRYRQIAACWARASGLGQYDAKARMAEALKRLKDYEASGKPKAGGGY